MSTTVLLAILIACGGGGSSSGGGGGGGQVISVTVSPNTAAVPVTQTKTFTATVSNTTNTTVTWSVQESTGGSVSSAGLYTAPNQAGTYHVIATSQADSTKSGSAVVTVTAPAPTFTSTPPTSASQGAELDYTVAATDSAGGTVTFQLTTAPTGATLTGSAMKWTPTAAQSRTANSFTITATTSEGGSGTQSFSISPSGTINVDRIFTYHSTDIHGNFNPPDLVTDLTPFPIAVYVPDGSGNFTTIAATGSGTGHYSALNVPAGYYWFENGASNYIWTPQSTIDAGNDENGRDYSTIAYGTAGTKLAVSMSSASAWQTTDIAVVNSPNSLDYLPFASASAGDTTLTATINMQNQPLMDSNLGDYAIAYQLVHHSVTGGGYVAIERFYGPQAFTTTTGTSNTLTGAFTQLTTPNTVRLSVKASQFAAFTAAMGPSGTATNYSTCTFVRALPSTASTGYTGVAGDILLTDDCSSGTPTVNDEDLGAVSYGNPYPRYASDSQSTTTWPLFAGFVHQVQVPYQLTGTTTPYKATATNIAYSTTLPTSASPIVPLVSPVRNPMISPFGGTSTSLLATTVTGVGVTPVISWQAPTTGTPTGYTVAVIPLFPSGSTTVGLSPVVLWVGGSVNSIQLPPGVLTLGGSYAIRITARVVANNIDAEQSPFRRSLPFAQSEVLSGVVTP